MRSASLRRNSSALACGYCDRNPVIASKRADLLSCASICILRVGLACLHNWICRASILGCVSVKSARIVLVYQLIQQTLIQHRRGQTAMCIPRWPLLRQRQRLP